MKKGTYYGAPYPRATGPHPEPMGDVRECSRCNGSGEIAVRCTFPMTEVGPGPVPDYAKGITGSKCPDCDGTGVVNVADAEDL